MKNSEFSNPLVSIIIITYNSSKYVLETLESAKDQTYQNVELIVSDDCSTDNTLEICKEWIEINKERFIRTELLTVEKNTGIPANGNRGLYASKGEYLKFIAGDDVISPEFIEKSLEVFQSDSEIAVTYTDTIIIDGDSNFVRKVPNRKYKSGYIFKEIFFNDFWPSAPSFCFKRSAMLEAGGFDETICVEDYLLILKLARNNKIQFINEYLTYYRHHGSNISKNRTFLYQGHLDTINRFKDYEGYGKRIKQLNVSLIYDYAKINKKNAIKLILKNLNTLSFKSIWLKIFYRLLIPYKYLT